MIARTARQFPVIVALVVVLALAPIAFAAKGGGGGKPGGGGSGGGTISLAPLVYDANANGLPNWADIVVFNISTTATSAPYVNLQCVQNGAVVLNGWNGYFVGAINRVGREKPWNIGEFYGKSYFCNPRGKIIAQASRNKDEVVVADLDLDMIAEVRNVWQFYRDRRPDSYKPLVQQAGKAAGI